MSCLSDYPDLDAMHQKAQIPTEWSKILPLSRHFDDSLVFRCRHDVAQVSVSISVSDIMHGKNWKLFDAAKLFCGVHLVSSVDWHLQALFMHRDTMKKLRWYGETFCILRAKFPKIVADAILAMCAIDDTTCRGFHASLLSNNPRVNWQFYSNFKHKKVHVPLYFNVTSQKPLLRPEYDALDIEIENAQVEFELYYRPFYCLPQSPLRFGFQCRCMWQLMRITEVLRCYEFAEDTREVLLRVEDASNVFLEKALLHTGNEMLELYPENSYRTGNSRWFQFSLPQNDKVARLKFIGVATSRYAVYGKRCRRLYYQSGLAAFAEQSIF